MATIYFHFSMGGIGKGSTDDRSWCEKVTGTNSAYCSSFSFEHELQKISKRDRPVDKPAAVHKSSLYNRGFIWRKDVLPFYFFSLPKLFFIASRTIASHKHDSNFFLICTGSGMVQSFISVGYHEKGRGSTITMKRVNSNINISLNSQIHMKRRSLIRREATYSDRTTNPQKK